MKERELEKKTNPPGYEEKEKEKESKRADGTQLFYVCF